MANSASLDGAGEARRIATARPRIRGKFIYGGDEKLYLCGVTYGAFAPNEEGREYHDLARIESDFAQMAANGVNAVRIPHTVPPLSLLDAAAQHGLRVMVGLSAEQYAGYLTDTRGAPDIEELIRAKVRSCARHPALLCYALGNEIPASTVRWLGERRVARYLRRLYDAVKDEDPEALVTYVNYPSTEYLRLDFLELVAFNVYLESQDRFEAYLARLHNLAGDRPLLMSEIGLDSLRNGEQEQAAAVDWQIRTTFSSGCAGAFLFAWTDEWYRAGEQVDDWAFGITDRQRRPKPALAATRRAFVDAPAYARDGASPSISVVVCSYNGSRTIGECLDGLSKLEYPNFEVIVVDDGSTDATAATARRDGVQLISTENRGLSHARNVGLAAARGEIVAYLDDDACPDPHWLTYIAMAFTSTSHAGIGGPNIAPDGDGAIAECVRRAPGGPTHVLLGDREAEHLPGCNMAFRTSALRAIGGFDPQFRIAGDDVDVCWRLRDEGLTLGFSPAAVVWHHRRTSVRAYLRQQKNYGAAEALLERKWPERYNSRGHIRWSGRIYGSDIVRSRPRRAGRIYGGVWGLAPFQSLYEPAPTVLSSIVDWYLGVALLAFLSVLGVLWSPLLLALPLLGLVVIVPVAHAVATAARTDFPGRSRLRRLALRSLTALLHLLQPPARLTGRVSYGLHPWRRRCAARFALPRRRSVALWSESWRARHERLHALEQAARREGIAILRGGDYDQWDLELRDGPLGTARLLMDVEEHGAGAQLVRVRVWPRCSRSAIALLLADVALCTGAAFDAAWSALAVLGLAGVVLMVVALRDCLAPAASALRAFEQQVGAREDLVQTLERRITLFGGEEIA